MSYSALDVGYMKTALNLGRYGQGNVWPNPAVGCVLVSDKNIVVGRGWTKPGGRPHAETEALKMAGEKAFGATAYVTLEPCSHTGKTPPCASALISAGVKKVFVATTDPDSRVSGRGIKMLQEANIEVDVGLCKEEADIDHAGFFSRVMNNRPYITLKIATTIDGYIAASNGNSKWITGPLARQRGHLLRSRNDAILIGSGTLQVDNPSLTTRFNGAREIDQPIPVVLDSSLKTFNKNYSLYDNATDELPTWILHASEYGEEDMAVKLVHPDVSAFKVQKRNRRVDFESAMNILAQKGITRLLIEGGGQIAASALQADLVDELHWFCAPSVMGGDGIPAVGSMRILDLVHMPKFHMSHRSMLGNDSLTIFTRLKNS